MKKRLQQNPGIENSLDTDLPFIIYRGPMYQNGAKNY